MIGSPISERGDCLVLGLRFLKFFPSSALWYPIRVLIIALFVGVGFHCRLNPCITKMVNRRRSHRVHQVQQNVQQDEAMDPRSLARQFADVTPQIFKPFF